MITIPLPQPKTIVVVQQQQETATAVNVYGVTDNLQDSIKADIDFGTSDSRMQVVLWSGEEYAALTTFSKQDALNKLMTVISAM